jgi:hypothetical protein
VRRLYSTFAGSWPGVGLLLLRLVVASVLLLPAGMKLGGDLPLQSAVAAVSLAGFGVLLAVGLWTPFAGTLVAIAEASRVLTAGEDPLVGFLAGAIGGALALLGPGRWSVDARLFGWKRIDAPPHTSRSNAL